MRITILTSNKDHPVYPSLNTWKKLQGDKHEVCLLTNAQDISEGDFLFLISCSDIISQDIRSRFKHCLVVHASDLPKGRGWSPHIWQILEGKNDLIVSLIEAEDKVDTGRIWLQDKISFDGHELYQEINDKIFSSTLHLMTEAIQHHNTISPKEQSGSEATYYRKRSPEDGEVDIESSLESAFNLLRVSDFERYPAFFYRNGHKYLIKIEKSEDKEDDRG